ncbi:Outer membrane receptor proteins, mostly Fe transport [Robiginitalea myxolifaciens]|uniref:Outer membrane receptor proteins, mostly Fe transport n=1 Tax=Robiginitalea myxolifaciens TaxID=400055 RepID=A0A1I6FZ75_9FLAO|nr:TonB-dependent receptor [Robiginitalea myxolifaciens]SFR35191.1 Outer membrane receptor proteins, mostly Fe transport [Robiginitalea myxolifaciens]
MRTLIFGFIALTCLSLSGQSTGSIAGTITDREYNDDPLPFANILIKGTTTGTTSDFDGLYEIDGLDPGSYTVVFSYLGYETVEIPEVVVEAGKVTQINVPMSASEGVALDEVVVTTVARKDSEVALLLDQKSAVLIRESIGAQQLGRIGVSDVATATTKISGVSASEASGDIYIRGLGDRYLSTTLNGLPVPSDDVERKNIDLGLFPTRVIQNVSVGKTYSVQNTADQSSGTVNIATRELVGSTELAVGVQGGVNTNVAAGGVYDDFRTSPASANAPGGFYDNNGRTVQQLVTQQGWNTRTEENPMDYRVNLVAGKKFADRLSVLFTGSQSRSYDYGQGIFYQYRSNFVDDTITDATNWRKREVTSGLLDLVYFANENNKIKSSTIFLNTFTEEIYEGGRNGEGFIFEETDLDEGLAQFVRDQNIKQTQILITQLLGSHKITQKNTIQWALGYNRVNADEPNRIRNEVNFDPQNPSFVQLGRTGGFQQRKSSQLIEDNEYNGYIKDIIDIIQEEDKSFRVELGLNYRNKERDFESIFVGVEERTTNAINPPSIDNLGSIFQQSNFDSGVLEFNLLQPDLYTGELESKAAFADINLRIKKWNFNAGMRFQQDNIDVGFDVGNFPGRVGETNKEYSNLYPSANIRYALDDKNTLRLAVSSTITLPEFKEIAPFEYVSQVGQVTRGNPDLEASRNLNYDLKWEYFPSAGEVISFAAFYKDISDPINRVQDRGSAGVFSYFNSGDKAEVFGLEAEAKVDLITPPENSEGLREGGGLGLVFNASRMWHKQDLKEVRDADGNFIRTFQYKGLTEEGLQGASDWIFNASLTYTYESENPFTATLTGNYASDKIFSLGAPEIQSQADTFYNDAIVENGFVVLDAVLTKELGEHWRFRLIGRNLLTPTIERTQLVRPSTTNIETNEVVRSYTSGAQISLGLNYRF